MHSIFFYSVFVLDFILRNTYCCIEFLYYHMAVTVYYIIDILTLDSGSSDIYVEERPG